MIDYIIIIIIILIISYYIDHILIRIIFSFKFNILKKNCNKFFGGMDNNLRSLLGSLFVCPGEEIAPHSFLSLCSIILNVISNYMFKNDCVCKSLSVL